MAGKEEISPSIIIRRLEGIKGTSTLIMVALIIASLSMFFDGFDTFLTSYALPGIRATFKPPSPIYLALVIAITTAGMFVGSLLWPTISDRIGRKPAFSWSIIIYSLGTAASAAAPNLAALYAIRFVAGLGIGGLIPIANTYIVEYAPARLRAKLQPFIPTLFTVGWFAASAAGLFIEPYYGWRVLYLLGVIPAILVVFIWRYLPESVRYLLRKGDLEGASRILDRVGAPPAREVVVTDNEVEVATKPKFRELYAKEYRLRTALLSIAYFMIFATTYGFSALLPTVLSGPPYNMPVTISFTYSMIANIGAVVLSLTAIVSLDSLGRKGSGFMYSIITAVAFLAVGLVSPAKMLPLFLMLIFLTQAFNATVVAVNMWSAELYPTRMRATAEGHNMSWGRIGGIVIPLTAGYILAAFTNKYYLFLLFAILNIIAAATFPFLTETRRKVLEKIAR